MGNCGTKQRADYQSILVPLVAVLTGVQCTTALADLSDTDQNTSLSFSGYYRNQVTAGKTTLFEQKHYWQDISRLRLAWDYDSDALSVNVQVDNQTRLGPYRNTVESLWIDALVPPQYWDWQARAEGGSYDHLLRVYRGTVTLQTTLGDVRLGRQQINWATAFIWNPMDAFNPLNPLQLEQDERPGVDALLLNVNLAELSRLSLAYAPGHEQETRALGVRYKTSLDTQAGAFDAALAIGQFRNINKVALGASGAIGLIGLRGEWVLSDDQNPCAPHAPTCHADNYVEWVLGMDYTCLSGISYTLEHYFNGRGDTSPAYYRLTDVVASKTLAVGRHYLGGRIAKEFSPILSLSAILIRNLNDKSHYLQPEIDYSPPPLPDVWLKLGAQLFFGRKQSEYGALNSVFYLQGTYYF